jgi:[pyruvate, water dikinase]-phosphate phosphotransferase / [pyruvate, water dikinase] kinase
VRELAEIEKTLQAAHAQNGTVVHTLVDPHLRAGLVQRALQLGVCAIDLMGALLERLSSQSGMQPAGHPGLYRQLNQDYFNRIAAIEYTMAHDDGKDPEGWKQAEIMILGVSRCGKTPLSLYLSVLGWRVANLPLVPGIAPPEALFALDPLRVVGLDIDPWQLIQHRQRRQIQLGAPGPTAYTDPEAIETELKMARRIYRQHGFAVIQVTDKPVETSADEVIRLARRRESGE